MISATPAQNRLKPVTTARLPVEIVTTMQFAPNHMGNSPRGLPCRALSGMKSMLCVSTTKSGRSAAGAEAWSGVMALSPVRESLNAGRRLPGDRQGLAPRCRPRRCRPPSRAVWSGSA